MAFLASACAPVVTDSCSAAAGSDDDGLCLTGIERHDLRAAACDGRLQPRTLSLRRELSCLVQAVVWDCWHGRASCPG